MVAFPVPTFIPRGIKIFMSRKATLRDFFKVSMRHEKKRREKDPTVLITALGETSSWKKPVPRGHRCDKKYIL
jgi:hypothetical protein